MSPHSPESLTARERDVLRLLADRRQLVLEEVACALVLELSTVKTHCLRTYAKLGVHSRRDAVRVALEKSSLLEDAGDGK